MGFVAQDNDMLHIVELTFAAVQLIVVQFDSKLNLKFLTTSIMTTKYLIIWKFHLNPA